MFIREPMRTHSQDERNNTNSRSESYNQKQMLMLCSAFLPGLAFTSWECIPDLAEPRFLLAWTKLS